MLRAAPYTLLSLRKRTATLALAPHQYPFHYTATRCSSSSNDEDFLDYFDHTSNRAPINRSRDSQSRDFDDNRPGRDLKNNQRRQRRSHQNHHGQFQKHQNQNQAASIPQPRGTPHQKQQNYGQQQGKKFQQQKPQPTITKPDRLAKLINDLKMTIDKSKGATATPIFHDPQDQAPQERPQLLQPPESIPSSFSMKRDLSILPRQARPFPWSEQRGPGQQQEQQQQQQRYQQQQRQPQKEQQQNQQQSQQHLHPQGFQQQQRDLQDRMRQHINPFKGLPRRNFQDGLEFLEGRSSRETDSAKKNQAAPDQVTRTVTLPSAVADISLMETASMFRIKADDLLEKLQSLGTDTKLGKELRLDMDTLELLAMEFGIETIRVESEVVKDNEELLMNQRRTDNVSASFPPRPPVVCIMGHVDHGKTTLMDALRRRSMAQPQQKSKKTKEKQGKGTGLSADIAGTEAGGITQIISAFQVEVEGQDNKVTFLDTPGHAAFKSMRQSGSHAADVIVLVIAADDGVSEQTIEILDFYKSIVKGSNGGITMMVALNKIDKPGIDVGEARRRVENQLLEHEILCEGMPGTSEYGPPVQVIPTSGLTGQGLNELIEGLVLQSEVMDLRADHEACAEGIVMDARIEKGLGVVADCIIRWGSIQKGDIIVSGSQASRVRLLKDVNGQVLNRGMPSQPVRIVGFKSLPKAGDPILCVESQEVADEMVEQRAAVNEEVVDRTINADEVEIHINGMRRRDTRRVAKFHELAGLEESDGTIRIPIVVKADADGSLSAIRDSLISLGAKSSHKVIVDPIQEGIGDITASDIQMAKESEACIFAFGLKRIDPAMLNLAESEGVVIRSNDIIYSLLDEAKETLGKYLPPQPVEHVHGRGTIQAIFVVDGDSGEEKVAGLRVMDGFLYKEKSANDLRCHFRVYRNGTLISPESNTVTAASLRKFKEQVPSVRRGEECGLALCGFEDFQEGDEIECYSVEMKSPTL